MENQGEYFAPPSSSRTGELPGVASTVAITFIFGLFGLIPAIRNSRRAREVGTPTNRYWSAFWWTILASTALYVALIVGLVLLVVAVASTSTSTVVGASRPTSAVAAGSTGSSQNVPGYTNPETPDAKAISGLIYKPEPDHTHVEGTITYDASPPVGGNHSQYWADCSGTVYPNAIANENAVHMLEHGAVWITYKPGLADDQVAALSKLVSGRDRMAMSPYPDLKTNISLQAWDYQLFVDSASDPRIQQFILALRFNPATTPEQSATCSQPSFIANPSTFGNPLWVPKN